MPIASGNGSGRAATAVLTSSASSVASTWAANEPNADRFTSPSDGWAGVGATASRILNATAPIELKSARAKGTSRPTRLSTSETLSSLCAPANASLSWRVTPRLSSRVPEATNRLMRRAHRCRVRPTSAVCADTSVKNPVITSRKCGSSCGSWLVTRSMSATSAARCPGSWIIRVNAEYEALSRDANSDSQSSNSRRWRSR